MATFHTYIRAYNQSTRSSSSVCAHKTKVFLVSWPICNYLFGIFRPAIYLRLSKTVGIHNKCLSVCLSQRGEKIDSGSVRTIRTFPFHLLGTCTNHCCSYVSYPHSRWIRFIELLYKALPAYVACMHAIRVLSFWHISKNLIVRTVDRCFSDRKVKWFCSFKCSTNY